MPREAGSFARRLIIPFLLGLCLSLIYTTLQETRLIKSTGGFLIKRDFPPLIYVPEHHTGPRVYAASAILLEAATGTILYAQDEHIRRAPASTTKIMTALVALEKGNLRDLVTVGPWASSTPGSSVNLHAGDRLSLGELLQGLMLCSGNDAAAAIAEHLAGDENAFAALMNMKAREFGAFNTHFRNPHGLSAIGHYTTAFDLALITRHALQIPAFARLVRTREEELAWAEGERRAGIANTNRLLWSFAGADGVKTGTTSEAGQCLVASATRGGRQLIAVVLRSADRWRDAAVLLDYGFSAFSLMVMAEPKEEAARIDVADGTRARLGLLPRRRLALVCRRGQENLVSLKTSLPSHPPAAPIRPGQVLGRLTAYYDGEEVESVDLLAKQAVLRRRVFWPWAGKAQ